MTNPSKKQSSLLGLFCATLYVFFVGNIFSIIIMIAVGYTLKRIDFLSSNDGDILNKIVNYK